MVFTVCVDGPRPQLEPGEQWLPTPFALDVWGKCQTTKRSVVLALLREGWWPLKPPGFGEPPGPVDHI